MRKFVRFLSPIDALFITFVLLLSIVSLIFAARVHSWTEIVLINLLASGVVAVLGYAASTSKRTLVRVVHDWYAVLVVLLVFKEVYIIIQSLGRHDWDSLLIAIDRAIFAGTDPTIWLARFATPIATEILQIAYASYYFIMLAVAIELYVRDERQRFTYVVFTILYGFFLSYIGYILFPAVGPRFTLHNFGALNTDLPGSWLTGAIRDLLNAGESIPRGATNAILVAQRDAFPSGHTQMTLISIYFAHRFSLKSRYVVTLFGVLLIVSTVYLRYHYVVDVLGGVLFMWLTLATAPMLYEWWNGSCSGEAGKPLGL